jgi:hypothetical protein
MLTMHELKKAYADNPEFIEMVKPYFQSSYPSLFEKDKDGRTLIIKLHAKTIKPLV